MHPARRFHVTDPAVLRQRVLDHPFAVISAVSDGQPVAAHAPVLPSGGGGPLSLRFHFSVANPVTKALLAGSPALVPVLGHVWTFVPTLRGIISRSCVSEAYSLPYDSFTQFFREPKR